MFTVLLYFIFSYMFTKKRKHIFAFVVILQKKCLYISKMSIVY